MVGLYQVNIRENGAARHAVIEGLHDGKGVPVGYGDWVEAVVVTAEAP
jgi:hypothetical protein